ncbi:hypothetical protein [Streptomyces sp. NPDC047706]|uniref:hypothetical protein n=1 Tax=Streptomyces sp. NPDC047706 TaxID=3365486 RepID=UPI00371F46F0
MSAGVLHPDRYGPILSDSFTAWTDLLASVFRDFGMDRARAATQATLLTDAVFGLPVAPLVDDHGIGPTRPSRHSSTAWNPDGTPRRQNPSRRDRPPARRRQRGDEGPAQQSARPAAA